MSGVRGIKPCAVYLPVGPTMCDSVDEDPLDDLLRDANCAAALFTVVLRKYRSDLLFDFNLSFGVVKGISLEDRLMTYFLERENAFNELANLVSKVKARTLFNKFLKKWF